MSIVVPQIAAGTTKVRAKQYIAELYPNVALVARKKSGKTVVLYNLLKAMCSRYTRVIIICPTVTKDKTYGAILAMLRKRGCEVLCYTEIGDNITRHIAPPAEPERSEDEDGADERSKQIEQSELGQLMFGGMQHSATDGPDGDANDSDDAKDEEAMEAERDRRAAKRGTPTDLYVLDDLGEEMRHASVYQLLKMNRHHHAAVLMSIQYPNNLTPSSWKQLDAALLFAHHNDKKLREMYTALDPPVDFERFRAMYLEATKPEYSFLTIEHGSDRPFRIQFRKKLSSA